MAATILLFVLLTKMQRNIRAQTNSSTEDGQMNAKQPRTRTKWTVDMNTALINLVCSKMAAAHVLTKSVLNFVFLVYLLCSSDLYTLNDISNVAESGSGLCLDFSTDNYCLWTNLAFGKLRN